MKKKRGFTIIELVVSMAIFLIVATLAVGAYVSVIRMKALTSNMRESQQKLRIALEMITRLSRQADRVIVSDNGKDLWVFFPNKTGYKFQIKQYSASIGPTLYVYDCLDYTTCPTSSDLLGGTIKLNETESYFQKEGTVPPKLNVQIAGVINGGGSTYFSDSLNINTSIILENIR